MTVPSTLPQLIAARRRGELNRDQYWVAMQEFHRGLRSYVDLVSASGIESIEIGSDALRIQFRDGVRIDWDPDDLSSPPSVLLNEGAYEATEWTVIRSLGVGQGAVLDVGANIGWYAVRLAWERGDRPGIHAFEPLPPTFGPPGRERPAERIRRSGVVSRLRTQ